uniref:Uncharacterized protein n=1 Tax=Mimiviridae sp. ChoanoV1 TaxID=2596887 RepID=A0A5B8HUW7_9VIRU|nr:hypothetical protein 1_114 [Mimiviridae sp. ChoanoV1]
MENIKVQIWPDSNNQGLNPGWIKNTAVTNKNNEEENNPIPIIGPSNIPIPGALSFDPNEQEENRFKGCVAIENGIGKYVSFNTKVPFNGINGRNLDFNLNFNNLVDDQNLNNVGFFYNDNKSSNTNIINETLNSIENKNNSFNYPYFIYNQNNKNNLSFKKIYFIPDDSFENYKVLVRNGTLLNTDSEDSNILYDNNDNEFIEVENNVFNFKNLNSKSFNYYNETLSGNNIDKNLLYIENEGNLCFFTKKIFTNNSLSVHASSDKISFFLCKLSNLEVDSELKYYIEDDKNLIFRYKNFFDRDNSKYVNIEVKLALSNNSIDTDNIDDDINLKQGTIVITYGKIASEINPLVGLSNGENINTSENLVNYDNLLDTQWLNENGYGVPKLGACIGFRYSNQDKRNNVFTELDSLDLVLKHNINSNDNYLKLLISDNEWGNEYSLDDKYYIKILDIGSELPESFFIGIQSIYDYPEYNSDNFNVNNFSSVTNENKYTGVINNFGFELDNDIFNNLTDITDDNNSNINDFKWTKIYPNIDNDLNRLYNSKIHSIFIKKKKVSNFEENGKIVITENNRYLLKIIFTLNSDSELPEPNTEKELSIVNNNNGPFHYIPLNVGSEQNKTFIIKNDILERNKTYTVSLSDSLGNTNRIGYGFKTFFKDKDDLILNTTNDLTSFPSFNFTHSGDYFDELDSSDIAYKLEIINDRKFPYYKINISEVVNTSSSLESKLEFTRGIEYKIKEDEDDGINKLFIGNNTIGEDITRWILLEDTSDSSSESYTFRINNEVANTIDLTSDFTPNNFFIEMNDFIKTTNDNQENNDDKIEDNSVSDLAFNTGTTNTSFEDRHKIYLPFIIPKSKRQFQNISGTDKPTLKNYGNNFQIYNNKFYKNKTFTTTTENFTVNKYLALQYSINQVGENYIEIDKLKIKVNNENLYFVSVIESPKQSVNAALEIDFNPNKNNIDDGLLYIGYENEGDSADVEFNISFDITLSDPTQTNHILTKYKIISP